MILMINGAFGVGKTTVARLLRRKLKGSVLFNPELAGSLLMRIPVNFKGSGTDDFQDIQLWRRSIAGGVKICGMFGETIIVPMAFKRIDYFEEVRADLERLDKNTRVFCLKAGIDVIAERLRLRGEWIDADGDNWSLRNARLCVDAHRDERFGESVETSGRSAEQVAIEILSRLPRRIDQ
jgi:tRNA uridine 5-carbamoylmethylation protein Kti12